MAIELTYRGKLCTSILLVPVKDNHGCSDTVGIRCHGRGTSDDAWECTVCGTDVFDRRKRLEVAREMGVAKLCVAQRQWAQHESDTV
jgi:hypothetical protein